MTYDKLAHHQLAQPNYSVSDDIEHSQARSSVLVIARKGQPNSSVSVIIGEKQPISSVSVDVGKSQASSCLLVNGVIVQLKPSLRLVLLLLATTI